MEIARNGQFTCPVGCGAVFLSSGPPRGSLPDLTDPTAIRVAAAAVSSDELSSDPTAAAVGRWVTSALRNASCAALDGIDTLEALKAAAEAGRVPAIMCVHRLRGGVVAEFVPQLLALGGGAGAIRDVGGAGSGGFTAVAWFRFTPRADLPDDVKCDPYADLLGVDLEQMRWWGSAGCMQTLTLKAVSPAPVTVRLEPDALTRGPTAPRRHVTSWALPAGGAWRA